MNDSVIIARHKTYIDIETLGNRQAPPLAVSITVYTGHITRSMQTNAGRSATSVKLSISDKLSLPLSFYESGTAAGRRGGPRRVLRRPAAPYKTRYVGP